MRERGRNNDNKIIPLQLIQYENQYKSKQKKFTLDVDVCIEYDTLKCLVSLSALGIEKDEVYFYMNKPTWRRI